MFKVLNRIYMVNFFKTCLVLIVCGCASDKNETEPTANEPTPISKNSDAQSCRYQGLSILEIQVSLQFEQEYLEIEDFDDISVVATEYSFSESFTRNRVDLDNRMASFSTSNTRLGRYDISVSKPGYVTDTSIKRREYKTNECRILRDVFVITLRKEL